VRRAAKIDDNQAAIVKALRAIPGVTVRSLAAVGDGMPDLAVGHRGKTYLLEIKDGSKPPSKQKLTTMEQEFFDTWTGHAVVVSSVKQAIMEVIFEGRAP